MADLNDAFVVNTKPSAPLNANAPGEGTDTQVSNFVTVQSLSTFAIATPVLKTIWELIKSLAGSGWAESYWTPFGICVVYGIWQLLISLVGEKRVKGPAAISSAVFVAAANAGILSASIIGLTETTGIGETA
jgi:hypothetical protein